MNTFLTAIQDFWQITTNDIHITIVNLVEAWPIKLAWAILMWLATHALDLKLHIICGFAALEFLDCLTRWLALSKALITETAPDGAPSLYDCFRGIPAAHRSGRINSRKMRDAFKSKIITYIILILGSSIGDWAIALTGKTPMLLTIVVAYLAATELLSLLENLDEAGVDSAHNLLEIAKDKLGGVINPLNKDKE